MILMTALFWNYFEVTISASIVIGVILLLRLFSRRVPKSIVCVLWAILFVRLLLPIQIESPLSLQTNASTVFRNEVQYSAEEQEIIHFVQSPQFSEEVYTPVRIDYSSIIAVVWLTGACAVMLYMFASYLRLRHSLRKAVVKESGVFVAPGLKTAFLFGYIRPRIYLPLGLDEQSSAMVITHERAHLKRGDGWLKLLGFFALAVHWFNPLVWISYALLCRDIEDACDEYVVRDMQESDRKAYASALLACNSCHSRLLGSPVAFAEDNVKKRIVRVLNYRKPALWICIAAVVTVLVVSVCVLPDAMGPQHPEHYDELISMLGQPIDDVCTELDITRNDIIEVERDVLQTPITVEFAGVDLTLVLIKRIDADILGGFQYYAVYEDDRNNAVNDTVAISNKIYDNFGNGYLRSSRLLSDATVDSVNAMFGSTGKAKGSFYCAWDLTDSGDGNIEAYLSELKESAVWQNMYKEAGFAPAYQMEFHAYNDLSEEKATIVIIYGTTAAARTYATYAEPQSWWDKVLDWLK